MSLDLSCSFQTSSPDDVNVVSIRARYLAQKQRTQVSARILHRLLPPEIQALCKAETLQKKLERPSSGRDGDRAIPAAVVEAMWKTYAKIPGHKQTVRADEVTLLATFKGKANLATDGPCAVTQIRRAKNMAQVQTADFHSEMKKRIGLSQSSSAALLYEDSPTVPRYHAAVALAFLEESCRKRDPLKSPVALEDFRARYRVERERTRVGLKRLYPLLPQEIRDLCSLKTIDDALVSKTTDRNFFSRVAAEAMWSLYGMLPAWDAPVVLNPEVPLPDIKLFMSAKVAVAQISGVRNILGISKQDFLTGIQDSAGITYGVAEQLYYCKTDSLPRGRVVLTLAYLDTLAQRVDKDISQMKTAFRSTDKAIPNQPSTAPAP